MNRRTLALATIALLSFAVALPTGDVAAQQMQRVSFKTPAANSKYTVQHVLDVGDVPGHQVRLFELRRTFPTDAPTINGVKLKEPSDAVCLTTSTRTAPIPIIPST